MQLVVSVKNNKDYQRLCIYQFLKLVGPAYLGYLCLPSFVAVVFTAQSTQPRVNIIEGCYAFGTLESML